MLLLAHLQPSSELSEKKNILIRHSVHCSGKAQLTSNNAILRLTLADLTIEQFTATFSDLFSQKSFLKKKRKEERPLPLWRHTTYKMFPVQDKLQAHTIILA